MMSKRTEKRANFVAFISVLIGIMLVAYFEYDPNRTELHRHKPGFIHYPNFKKDAILICGDTSFIKYEKHIRINDWSKMWITDKNNIPIVKELK